VSSCSSHLRSVWNRISCQQVPYTCKPCARILSVQCSAWGPPQVPLRSSRSARIVLAPRFI
jgi:hypothetical protein